MPIHVEYMHWNDTEAVVAVVLACVGEMMALFVTTIFVQYNNTPMVKVS